MKPDLKSPKFLTPELNSLKFGLKPLEYFKSLKSPKSLKALKSDMKSVKAGVQAPKEQLAPRWKLLFFKSHEASFQLTICFH